MATLPPPLCVSFSLCVYLSGGMWLHLGPIHIIQDYLLKICHLNTSAKILFPNMVTFTDPKYLTSISFGGPFFGAYPNIHPLLLVTSPLLLLGKLYPPNGGNVWTQFIFWVKLALLPLWIYDKDLVNQHILSPLAIIIGSVICMWLKLTAPLSKTFVGTNGRHDFCCGTARLNKRYTLTHLLGRIMR